MILFFLDAQPGGVLVWTDLYTDGVIKHRSGIPVGDQTTVNTWTPQCTISGGTEQIVTNGLITAGGKISGASITSTGAISRASISFTGAISSGTMTSTGYLAINHCNSRQTGYSTGYGLLSRMRPKQLGGFRTM